MHKPHASLTTLLTALLGMALSTTLAAQEPAASDTLVAPPASTDETPVAEPASTEPASTEPASTEPASTEPASTEPESVLVTGEHPGPGLWKVSRGENVLWILATYAPLPKDMLWRSAEVEAAIAQSQEVLYPGRLDVGVDVGLLKGITLIPALLKATKNPDGAKLKDLLPAETYAKWSLLKAKYIGEDGGVEKLRPTLAANQLRGAAVRKSGLVYERKIGSIVDKLAKKHKVRIRRLPAVKRESHVENPRRILKATHKVQFADVECFSRSLERLEADVEVLQVRANAWAAGDLEALRDPANAEPKGACQAEMMQELEQGALADEVGAREAIDDLKQQSKLATAEVERSWFEAVEAALATQRSTFTLLSVDNVLRPDGYLAKLRASGYQVEEPG